MTRLGLRLGEAIVLEPSYYSDRWLTVQRALKGRSLKAPIRSTKNNRCNGLPVPEDLEAWIEKHVPKERRLQSRTLFANPKASNPDLRWTPTSFRRTWEKACAQVGVKVSPYEGTKHALASGLKRQGIDDRVIQHILGHADRRSVERYARLEDQAVVTALRPRQPRSGNGI